MYLLAFFTTVISVDTAFGVKLTLLILMPNITFSWYFLLVWLFSRPGLRQRYRRFEGRAHLGFGVLLVALGLGVALSSR